MRPFTYKIESSNEYYILVKYMKGKTYKNPFSVTEIYSDINKAEKIVKRDRKDKFPHKIYKRTSPIKLERKNNYYVVVGYENLPDPIVSDIFIQMEDAKSKAKEIPNSQIYTRPLI